MFDPIDGGVCGAKPEESENDIFSSAAHDVEEMFLSYPFDIGVKGTSIMDCTCFVRSLVYIVNSDGGGKFFCEEAVFPDELPVDARDVSTGVYQCGGVDDFEGVRRGDQLNRDTYRFIQC